MSNKFEDTSNKNISEAFEFLNKKAKHQGSNQYFSENEKEESTEDLVKQHERRGHLDNKPARKALQRNDITKDHLKRIFHAGHALKQVLSHPKVDKEMMKGFLDHAHEHSKNPYYQKEIANKGMEMGINHPLIDKMKKGELKPTALNLGNGPSKDYAPNKSGMNWTGD